MVCYTTNNTALPLLQRWSTQDLLIYCILLDIGLVITRAWKAMSLKMRLFFFSGVKICKRWLVEEQ